MFGKVMLFYTVASTAIALVAQALGASIGVVLFASFLVPPVLHLAVVVARYRGLL